MGLSAKMLAPVARGQPVIHGDYVKAQTCTTSAR
jgi:hypothetical protein